MPPEEKELLYRTVELEEENNKMLRSMRRAQRIARVMSIIYWIFIIGSAVGAYYFIQPYLDPIYSIFGKAKDNLNSVNGLLQSFKQ
jgi:hypothetical protein